MNIRPIRTEAEYEAALAKIDCLIDAPDGSPQAEYLDILSTLVEVYEEQHYPIPLPGDASQYKREKRQTEKLTSRKRPSSPSRWGVRAV